MKILNEIVDHLVFGGWYFLIYQNIWLFFKRSNWIYFWYNNYITQCNVLGLISNTQFTIQMALCSLPFHFFYLCPHTIAQRQILSVISFVSFYFFFNLSNVHFILLLLLLLLSSFFFHFLSLLLSFLLTYRKIYIFFIFLFLHIHIHTQK